LLTRYWFEFVSKPGEVSPCGTVSGLGVTAYSYDDAIAIITAKIFTDNNMPEIKTCIENIDVSTLDKGHVLPNIGPSNFRGIWFPKGLDLTDK